MVKGAFVSPSTTVANLPTYRIKANPAITELWIGGKTNNKKIGKQKITSK